MPSKELAKLERELQELTAESVVLEKKRDLKQQIKTLHKKRSAQLFDEKHKFLGSVGRTGGKIVGGLGQLKKNLLTPLTPAQVKAKNLRAKRLKETIKNVDELVNMY